MRDLKNFYIRTYGCQMNELDSEVMIGMLERRGLRRVEDEMEADLLLYNTCSIRDLAERKVMGKLGQLGVTRQRDAVIGVTGCMANAKKEGLFRKLPHVDFVLGTNNIHELDDVLDEVICTGKPSYRTDREFHTEIDYAGATRKGAASAFVSIIRGCDKYCTYCVVPYTRGPEVSRSPESILEECRQLADQGFREITVLGQNVNSYGKDKPEFGCLFHDLLHRIDQIEGIDRVRFMTSHPVDITRELMEAVRDLPSLCEFVHFPVQAGSNRILRKMNRKYTVEEYLRKVEMFRSIVPNVSLGTDIIVGFPTETQAEFEETYQIMKEIEYSTAFIFAYSPRKGTPSTRWMDDVAEEAKNERLQRLLELQEEIGARQRSEMLGQTHEVLVERLSGKDNSNVKGRTRCWKNVVFPGGKELVGTMQNVKLHSFSHQTLIGSLESSQVA